MATDNRIHAHDRRRYSAPPRPCSDGRRLRACSSPLGTAGGCHHRAMIVVAVFARSAGALRSDRNDFGGMLAAARAGAPARHRQLRARRPLAHHLRLADGAAGRLPLVAHRLDPGRHHRRRVGLLRRPHRHDRPALHGHHPRVSDHRPGAGRGGDPGQRRRRTSSSPSGSPWSRGGARGALSALAVREMPYIDAARTAGFCHARIIFRHIVPNVVAPYLIMLTALSARPSCWRPRCPSSGWA